MSALCCYLDSSGTELFCGGLYNLSVLSQGNSWPGLWLWLNFQRFQQPKEVPVLSQVLIHQQTLTSTFLNWHDHLLKRAWAGSSWALFIKISWNLLPFSKRKPFFPELNSKILHLCWEVHNVYMETFGVSIYLGPHTFLYAQSWWCLPEEQDWGSGDTLETTDTTLVPWSFSA